jgi:hypothetical protein
MPAFNSDVGAVSCTSPLFTTYLLSYLPACHPTPLQVMPPAPVYAEGADLLPLPVMPIRTDFIAAAAPVQHQYNTHGRADSSHIEPIATMTITRAPTLKHNAALGGIAAALSLASLVAPAPAMAVAGVLGLVQGVRMAVRAARRRRGSVYRSRRLSGSLMSTA